MITERIAQQTLMSRIERRRCRKSTSNATDFVIFDRFRPKPLFQCEAKCETIDFTLMQRKLFLTRKVLHLASF